MTVVRLLHDPFFRKALENPLVAKEFFETRLPDDFKKLIDLDTLKMEKESFVEPSLKKSICDVLFSVNINNAQGYLLVEHQSKPDYWIAYRLLKYMANIWARYLDLNPEAKYLPIIYPIVFYNGKRSYSVSENLWSLFSDQELSKKIFMAGYQLINLQKIPDEQIKENLWSGTLEFFMKHANKRNSLKIWENIREKLPELIKVEIGYGYIEILLSYTLRKINEEDKINLYRLLNATLGQEQGDKLMTSVAQKLYDEGKAEGKAEGKSEEKLIIAKNLLKTGISIEVIASSTGLSAKEIEKLKKK